MQTHSQEKVCVSIAEHHTSTYAHTHIPQAGNVSGNFSPGKVRNKCTCQTSTKPHIPSLSQKANTTNSLAELEDSQGNSIKHIG